MSPVTKSGVFLHVLVFFFMLTTSFAADARRSKRDLIPDPKKYAALVMHADTGMILHQKNATKKRHPASLVKMMTLYMVFDAIDRGKLSPNSYLAASRHAARQPSLNIGMKRGEKIKVIDGIYALSVRSANDVAVVFAEAISGSERQFAKDMTRVAKRLGMKNTTFKNASGLYHKHQKTTAKDMAKLLVALQKDFPKYYRYMSRTKFARKGRNYKTHNKVLINYKGATGGKTGYINASGFNLATSAKRRGHNLIAVVMGGKTSKSRDKIMISLLDKGFKKIGRTPVKRVGTFAKIPVPTLRPWSGSEKKVAKNTKSGRQKWTIELGGFDREHEVVSAVTNAMDVAPDQLAFSQINFINRDVDGQNSHWARFVSLTEQQAKSACEALKTNDTMCKIVSDK